MSDYDMGDLDVRWRPQDGWPGKRTSDPAPSPFRSPWGSVIKLLKRELNMLGAQRVVVELDMGEAMFKLNGLPRADARANSSGIIISFHSTYGPLRYYTDVFRTWKDNVYAIALALEALRRVDRYGVSKRGEQYTGWKQLGSGSTVGQQPTEMTPAEAAIFLAESAQRPLDWSAAVTDSSMARTLYRMAARKMHPDVGGDINQFIKLQEAYRVLGGTP